MSLILLLTYLFRPEWFNGLRLFVSIFTAVDYNLTHKKFNAITLKEISRLLSRLSRHCVYLQLPCNFWFFQIEIINLNTSDKKLLIFISEICNNSKERIIMYNNLIKLYAIKQTRNQGHYAWTKPCISKLIGFKHKTKQ